MWKWETIIGISVHTHTHTHTPKFTINICKISARHEPVCTSKAQTSCGLVPR